MLLAEIKQIRNSLNILKSIVTVNSV